VLRQSCVRIPKSQGESQDICGDQNDNFRDLHPASSQIKTVIMNYTGRRREQVPDAAHPGDPSSDGDATRAASIQQRSGRGNNAGWSVDPLGPNGSGDERATKSKAGWVERPGTAHFPSARRNICIFFGGP
jgi:hypothetical protein